MTMIPMNPNIPKLSIRILDGESTSGTAPEAIKDATEQKRKEFESSDDGRRAE